MQTRLTSAPLKRIIVSEATPLACYWLFSKTTVLLELLPKGDTLPPKRFSRRPAATLLWCKTGQSKRPSSIHFVQSRNCDNLLSSLFSLFILFILMVPSANITRDTMDYLISYEQINQGSKWKLNTIQRVSVNTHKTMNYTIKSHQRLKTRIQIGGTTPRHNLTILINVSTL